MRDVEKVERLRARARARPRNTKEIPIRSEIDWGRARNEIRRGNVVRETATKFSSNFFGANEEPSPNEAYGSPLVYISRIPGIIWKSEFARRERQRERGVPWMKTPWHKSKADRFIAQVDVEGHDEGKSGYPDIDRSGNKY